MKYLVGISQIEKGEPQVSKLRKREDDNLEIFEIEEILKKRGYLRSFEVGPEKLQPLQYIRRLYTSAYDRLPAEDIYQLL